MLRFVRRDTRPMDAAARAALRPYTGILADLLYARGVETAAQANLFLDPQLDELHDPLLLSDMDKALALLAQAKTENWPVVVYGDYDADGVSACSIMTESLRLYGLNATPHVPLRSEGYGLNIPAIEKLSTQYKLMVTVDLGITNAAEVTHAKELGMHVIVTDHHQPGLLPCPADAVVNPLLADYPFPKLCGAGVAFKLAIALHGLAVAMQWLDIAALATIADIVPLTDENRIIVAHGLPLIGQRPGLAALIDVAACRKPLTAETVAFQLAPRINAAGRIADANLGIQLLLTTDVAEAQTLAAQLDAANIERKRLEADATAQAAKQAEDHDFVRRRVLFVRGKGWHAGVVGLVAGKLNQRFGAPVCALSEENGILHGSLRGVRGVNLARCLQACDDLLLRYGGHEMAAGVTLTAENDAAFRERLEHAVHTSASPDVFVPAQEYDLPIALSDADDALLDALERLQPFGFGNPAPVFYTEGALLERRRACGAQGAHLQLTLREGNRSLAGIAFGMGAEATRLPDAVDAAFTLAREEYMGKVSIKCQVQAIRPFAAAQTKALAAGSDAPYHDAMLRLLRDELAVHPLLFAGKHEPDVELNKAVACDIAEVSAARARADAAERDATPDAPEIPPEPDMALLPAEDPWPEDVPDLKLAAPFAHEPAPQDMADASPEWDGRILPIDALLAGRQGSLFVAYTRETAAAFLQAHGDHVDLAQGAPTDPRCFHTLLVHPAPQAVAGRWKAVVLLDGSLTLQDAAFWQRSLPQAKVYAPKSGTALAAQASAVDAGDACYRALYRMLRCTVFSSLRQTAAAAQLSEAQTLAGLTAFDSLGLISLSEVPFQYILREPVKCSLADSPVLGALRALTAPEEAREC